MKNHQIKWAFFGSSNFSILVLNELETLGLVPELIVTTPDKPRGRGLKVAANAVKEWAEERDIAVFAPASLKGNADVLREQGPWDVFLIASYGKIVPAEILDIPNHKTLNIHPSLLPKFRGPSPIESAILATPAAENQTGVTIMQVDEQVDHGPIVAQKAVVVPASDWPPYYKDLEKILATEGAKLFAEILPDWVSGKITAVPQDHAAATFTKKISKDELLIDINDSVAARQNLAKIRAFSGNRGAYFLMKNSEAQNLPTEKRIIVTQAKIAEGQLVLEKVKPEGRNEMSFEDFKRGLRGAL